jgi:hypothetical protein
MYVTTCALMARIRADITVGLVVDTFTEGSMDADAVMCPTLDRTYKRLTKSTHCCSSRYCRPSPVWTNNTNAFAITECFKAIEEEWRASETTAEDNSLEDISLEAV